MPNVKDPQLYAALLERYSVRRYRPDPLPADALARIARLAQDAQPLFPENRYEARFHPGMRVDRELVRSFGAYGAFVNPPHALIPFIQGSRQPLLDWGYRAQHIVTGLTRLGHSSCYIGAVGRQANVRRRLKLPGDAVFGALLIFGTPARRATSSAHKRRRLPFKDIFFNESFNQPGEAPEPLRAVMTAAIAAPSAVNTQPWRFLWKAPWLHLFVQRHNRSYLSRANQAYRYVDGGIIMANISLALHALGTPAAWSFDTAPPRHPSDIEHLASIPLQP